MQLLRALLYGLGAVTLALGAAFALVTNVTHRVAFESAASQVQSGTVRTQEEMEARTRKAEAKLEAVRAGVQEAGFANVLRADLSSYFAVLGPLALLAFAKVSRKAQPVQVVALVLPVLLTMLLLGAQTYGLALLVLAIFVLLAFGLRSVAGGAGDA